MAISQGSTILSADIWSLGITAGDNPSTRAFINFHSNGNVEFWSRNTA